MKKYLKIFTLIFLGVFLIDNNIVIVNALESKSGNSKNNNEFSICEYSDEYLEWLNLPLEERRNIFRPEICKKQNITTNDFFNPNIYSFYNNAGSTNPSLPEKYDLRDVNGKSYVTSVKDQKETGLCWAFSAVASIESNLRKINGLDYDLSETHIGYSTSYYFKDGVNEEGKYGVYPGEAGHSFYVVAPYITNGKGPVLESEMNFENYYNYERESGINDYRYLKEIELSEIENKNKVLDINKIEYSRNDSCSVEVKEKIKTYIMNYGAVSASYNHINPTYINGSYFYNPVDTDTTHAVAIVGWDDSISPTNFATGAQPSKPGAWIVKNSWGDGCYDLEERILWISQIAVNGGYYNNVSEVPRYLAIQNLERNGYTIDTTNNTACRQMGDKGYYYISYEDNLICNYLTFFNDIDTEINDNTYYHDVFGFDTDGGFGTNTAYAANVFERDGNTLEVLNEITIGTSYENTNYELYFSEDGSLDNYIKIQDGSIDYVGYTKIKLDEPIYLKNNKFAIIVKYTSQIYGNIIPVQNGYNNNITVQSGISFASKDGENWEDISKNNRVASIKAHTDNIENISVTDVTLNKNNLTLIKGSTEKLIATIEPNNALNQNIIWKSSNEEVATIDENGKITSKKRGTTIITVTTEDGNKTDSCEVTVIEPSIIINNSTVNSNLNNGENKLYSGYGGNISTNITTQDIDDGTDLNVTIKNQSNENVTSKFTIEGNSVSNNNANILITIPETITASEYIVEISTATTTKTYNFKVNEAVLISKITANDIVMNKGDTKQIVLTISPENITNNKVMYTSNNQAIATVTNDGKVTGIKEGNTTITIKALDGSNRQKIINVTVTDIKIELKDTSDYKITEEGNNKYIENIKLSKKDGEIIPLTRNSFISNFQVFNAKIYEKDGTTLVNADDAIIKTGMIIKVGEEKYSLVINGDVNGDGLLGSNDALLIRRHMVNLTVLEDIYLRAGAIDEGNLSSRAALLIRRFIVGLGSL